MTTTITWPETFGSPLASGYSISGQKNVLRTTMENGPEKTRVIGSANTKAVMASYVFTKETYALFITFYEETIGYGALSFLWTEPSTGTLREVRLSEPYNMSVIDPLNYKIGLSLEILPTGT